MDVGSSMNIYANLFGWHLFDLIFNFLAGTGLWVIPFLIFLWWAMTKREDGQRYDPSSSLISLELNVYIAIAVIIIFLIPSVNANKLLFIYDDGEKVQQVGKTKTTFDQYKDVVPNQVNIPIGWYGILYISSGFTKAIKQMLPTGTHARQIMYQLQQANMNDPKLQSKLTDFERRCATPAKARLTRLMTRYPESVVAKEITAKVKSVSKDVKDEWWIGQKFLGSDAWKVAPIYPGNEIFMDYLYNNSYSDDPPLCKPSNDPNNDRCIPLLDAPLYPRDGGNCQKMWKGGWATFGKGIVDELQDYYKQAGYDLENEDSFVYARLTSGTLHMKEKGIGNQSGNFWQWFSEKVGALGLNIGSFFADFFNSVLRFYLPILLGVITLLFVALLPVLMTFGKYQLSTIMSLGVTYFGIAFLPGIWHIASWIDQVLLLVIYGHKGIVEGMFSMQKAVLDMVSLSVYIIFTGLWLGVLRELGGYATYALHQGVSTGASEATSATGKCGRSASSTKNSITRDRGNGRGSILHNGLLGKKKDK